MFRNLLNKLKVVNIYLQFFLRNMKNIKLNPTLAYDVFYTIFNIYLWFKVKFSPIFIGTPWLMEEMLYNKTKTYLLTATYLISRDATSFKIDYV